MPRKVYRIWPLCPTFHNSASVSLFIFYAETAGVHFSIVESCKLIGLNPREFYADAVRRVHKKETPVTPQEYKLSRDTQTG